MSTDNINPNPSGLGAALMARITWPAIHTALAAIEHAAAGDKERHAHDLRLFFNAVLSTLLGGMAATIGDAATDELLAFSVQMRSEIVSRNLSTTSAMPSASGVH